MPQYPLHDRWLCKVASARMRATGQQVCVKPTVGAPRCPRGSPNSHAQAAASSVPLRAPTLRVADARLKPCATEECPCGLRSVSCRRTTDPNMHSVVAQAFPPPPRLRRAGLRGKALALPRHMTRDVSRSQLLSEQDGLNLRLGLFRASLDLVPRRSSPAGNTTRPGRCDHRSSPSLPRGPASSANDHLATSTRLHYSAPQRRPGRLACGYGLWAIGYRRSLTPVKGFFTDLSTGVEGSRSAPGRETIESDEPWPTSVSARAVVHPACRVRVGGPL